ncbi:helix-turn-helix transcriptional regulator [Streptomyces erythrochromogenes]|uniref:helix-turn-helix transcriptional regulator n=1 Tax=Streptomyces erythrochromogenes TaxID=285574 RepID=UPI00386D3E5C|nr:helix-turn-helix transcriptional regulator [Streptomyces erythrochromogenes]WSR88260.1 helix-turn-helix transcriptional regulator [Streptomyces erythrochromogenes]
MPKDAAVEEFAGLVRALKARDGRSYQALGRRLSVSASTLHRYCSGATVPEEFAVVDRLALLYGAYEEEQRAREADRARRATSPAPVPAAPESNPDPSAPQPGPGPARTRPRRTRPPRIRPCRGCPAPAAPLRGAPEQHIAEPGLAVLDITGRDEDTVRAPPGRAGRRRMDILAWNPLAAALLTDFSQLTDKQRNYARLVFSDSEMRRRYANWEKVAPDCVAFLRMEDARHPDDPSLTELVGELSIKDPHFRQWWAAHNVAAQTTGVKTLRHPLVGELTLDWETLAVAADPDQQLVVWTAAPGTPSHDSLDFLASWATTHPPTTTDNAPGTDTQAAAPSPLPQ